MPLLRGTPSPGSAKEMAHYQLFCRNHSTTRTIHFLTNHYFTIVKASNSHKEQIVISPFTATYFGGLRAPDATYFWVRLWTKYGTGNVLLCVTIGFAHKYIYMYKFITNKDMKEIYLSWFL